jgi:Zn-dependent M28 family amino/carboxypeptidase
MDQMGTMHSFDLSTKLSFRGVFKERDFITHNVAGLCPGEMDSYCIVSAHYDHLGIGPEIEGDSIYNGVNDNALGVSVLLEIGRVLKLHQEKMKRSVIFLFVTGEEKGLLGSTYYTDHPLYPLYKTVANINIDGIAILDQFKGMIAVGAELSSLDQLISSFLTEKGLTLCRDDDYLTWMPRSDQFAFAKAGIPSILIQDGCHFVHLSDKTAIQKMRDWQESIYHTPFDDLTQPINYEAVMEHAQILYDLIYFLANHNQEPSWKEGVPFRTIRLQTIAEKR